MKKRILSVMLTVVMLCCLVVVFGINTNAADIESGTTGSLSWSLSDDGILTIWGNGDMPNYSATSIPWKNYIDQIKKVIIQNGVTTVGDYAFYQCSNMTSVILPNTIQTTEGPSGGIGDYAFKGSGLTSIIIPQRVEQMNNGILADCPNLKTVCILGDIHWRSNGDSFRNSPISQVYYPQATDATYDHLNLSGCIVYVGGMYPITQTSSIIAYCNGGVLDGNLPEDFNAFATVKKDGFEFAGWYDNADFTGSPYITPQALKDNGKKACYAKWIPKTSEGYVAVSYVDSLNDLTSTWALSLDQEIGYNLSKLGLEHTGFNLVGWQINGDGTVYKNETKLHQILPSGTEITLHSVWKPIMYFGNHELIYDIEQGCYVAKYPYSSNGYVIKPADTFNIQESDGTSGYNTGVRTWVTPSNETVNQTTYNVKVPADSGRYNLTVKFSGGRYVVTTDILVDITVNTLDNITVKKDIDYEDAVNLNVGDIIEIAPNDIIGWQGEDRREMLDAGYLVCKVKEIPANIDDGIKVTLYVKDDVIETLPKSLYFDYHEEYEGVLTVTRHVILKPKDDIKVDYGFVIDDMNTIEAFGNYFDFDAFWNSLPSDTQANIETALTQAGATKDILPSVLFDASIYISISNIDSNEVLHAKSEHILEIYFRSFEVLFGLPNLLREYGLPDNYELSAQTGSLKVKDAVTIDFKAGGDFTNIDDADSAYNAQNIYKYLSSVADSILDEKSLSVADNILFKDSEGNPIQQLTGNISIEYCYENEDNLYSAGPLTWIGTEGSKYIARITYEGDEEYSSTQAFALVSIKAKLIVSAPKRTIFLGDTFNLDSIDLFFEGSVLEVPGLKDMLYAALPELIKSGVFVVKLEDDFDLNKAGEGDIIVTFDDGKIPDEYAVAAAIFKIVPQNGTLTVVDVSDVNSTIKSLQDKINDLEAAIGNLGTSNDIASQINELSAKITAAQNAINALDDTYATDAELASVKLDLEDQITAAQTALQGKIDDLSAKVTDLTTQLNTANGKIDTNSSDIATLKADVEALKSWQTAAQDAISTLQNLTASQGASIADLQTAVASLQTAVDAATSNITAAIDRIATLEGKVKDLETAKTKLEADIAALQTAVATKADAQALTDAINSLNASITEAKAYAESQDIALKTLLEAADATINTAIGELKSKISDLEAGLTAANGKIDTNSSDIATLKTDVEALKSWKAEAQAAIDSLESLSATKAELEAAVTELKAALKTANDNISAAIKRIEDLEGKVEDLEKDAEALEKAVSELKAAMTSTTEALAKEIKDLNTALEAAKKTAAEGDAELKKAIETAEAALKAAVGELEGRVAVIESVLSAANANINTNTTDIATLKANIKTIEMLQSEAEKTIKVLGTLIGTNEENIAVLQTSVTKLQESVYAADTKIAAAEARIAVLEGKVEELEGVKNELQASVANLQAALATKADREAVNNAVAALQASISALQSAQNNYIFADMTLKNELTAAINAAKELAISTAKDLVSQSATELRAAIDKKADSATLEAKAGELAEAIVLAETTSKAYADAQDAILKEALDAELLAANELIASLGIRMTDAEAAIDALESAVEALEKVTADDAQALKDAVASLSQALADAKALAAESDTAIETALGLVISEAQKALEAKISDVQSGLNKAIKDLKAADASNADELKKAIKSIEDAMAAAESARDAADSALDSKLTEAQNELTRKIAEVQANLDTAKTELGKAIESGDTALGEKIKELNEALEAAKAATEASDVTLKTELTAKIDEADAAIYALIEKLQKELQESNVELNTAIEEGDDELNTQFIISTSVAGVGVAGNIGLLAWIIISKKRRLF